MRKFRFPSPEEKRIEELERENIVVKLAMIELDIEKQSEIETLKLALIEQDMLINQLLEGNDNG